MPLCLAAAGLLAGGANPSSAQVTEMLHTSTTGSRDNYTGAIGCEFKVGPTNVVVSHVGVYDPSSGAGLMVSHQAGILDANIAAPTLLGGVVVPAGTSAYLTNGFWWMPLDPPLLLQSNTTYSLASMVGSGDGDGWPDLYTPASWNSWFVGAAASSTRHALYGPGGNTEWPPSYMIQNGNNNTYGNVTLGYIEVGQARAGVAQTNVMCPEGQTLQVGGFASGQRPMSYQWYKVGVGLLANQTDATLVIPNAPISASGTYYLSANNSLGGQQSANVTVSVTSYPVGITQDPTNVTVFALYPVTFSCVATGTPSIYYQWLRNGMPITGATSASYSMTAYQTNNGDAYSCVASNYLSSGPHIATSSGATLTVVPNLALPEAILHGARATSASTNKYTGSVGGFIPIGNTAPVVTHLGYYASQFTDAYKTNATLSVDHLLGIYDQAHTAPYALVNIAAGTHPVYKGYIWAALDSPITLPANTTVLLDANVYSAQTDANGSPVDPWGDSYPPPDWSSYYVTAPNNCSAVYAVALPLDSSSWVGSWGSGQTYSAPNMGVLALPVPSASLSPTAVTQYVGFNVTLSAGVAGQAPVTVQWYKQPGTPLTGQTSATLNLNNVQLSDAGNYYVIASNAVTGANSQSTNASVTVLPDVGPSVDQDIQPQEVWLYSQVTFAPVISGTPPISYQWTFNGSPIADATGSILTLPLASAANVGKYQLIATNSWGSTNTASVALTVDTPPAGSYARAVMGPDLLAYYRFSDVNSGLGVATNQGTLGFACNGTYEGSYYSDPGPTNFSNFEADNLAVWLDGFSADVKVPPMKVTVANATMAAWVHQNDSQAALQAADAAIVYHRATDVFGLSVSPDPVSTSMAVRYTWNGAHWNFVSGLVLPTNQWAFVAMVITPTNATLYLQDGTGMKTTNNPAVHQPATFSGPLYIGYDPQGAVTARRWGGDIDEVMVFDRDLSPVEINALYQGVPAPEKLTLTPSAPGQFVLTWTRLTATLLEATKVTGPWSPVDGATSPHRVTQSDTAKFYRLLMQ